MASKVESYDIVGSYNNQRFTSIDAERSVNVFEYIDPKGKKDKTLIFTSGLQNTNIVFFSGVNAPQTGAFRASFQYGNFHYHVIGNGFYSVNTSGAASHLGTLVTADGYVGIDANQFQLLIVDGQKGYIYDTVAGIFVQISDPAFPTNPIDCCYLDGFFVVISGLTNNFQLSSFNQGLIWGPTSGTTLNNDTFTWAMGSADIVLTSGTDANFQLGTPVSFNTNGGTGTLPSNIVAGQIYFVVSLPGGNILRVGLTVTSPAIVANTASTGTPGITNSGQLQLGQVTSHPGTLVACRTLHRRIFFFSQNFTEVWENSGIGFNLPFRRNNSSLIEVGCVAIGSVITNFDKLFFLSGDRGGLGPVMEVIGTDAIPVSTRALDFQLSQYDQDINIGVSDARGILVKDNGLIFYRLNFTKANHTYVYNVTLSNPQNDEGKLWHEEETLLGNRHHGQTQVFFQGDNYYGDYLAPILYFVSPDFITNDGETIRRMRIGRTITAPTYQRIRIDRFHLDILQGLIQEQLDLPNVIFIITEQTPNFILAENGAFIITEGSNQNDSGITIPAPNPVTFLSYSKDGGRTYGTKLDGTMGKIGERTFRTVWRKLGTIPRGQGFTPKIEFFDQLPYVILGAAWYYEVMPE